MAKSKPRKPKLTMFEGLRSSYIHLFIEDDDVPNLINISVNDELLDIRRARKLAAWLLKAADYLESKKK